MPQDACEGMAVAQEGGHAVRAECGHGNTHMIGVEYPYGHPDRFDGVSEWKCDICGQRYGRWTGRLLVGDDYEKRYGGQYEV